MFYETTNTECTKGLIHSQIINAVKSIIFKQHEIKSNAVITYYKNYFIQWWPFYTDKLNGNYVLKLLNYLIQ